MIVKSGPNTNFWLGRINSIKITLLPRLLYYFRSLPTPIKKKSLKDSPE